MSIDVSKVTVNFVTELNFVEISKVTVNFVVDTLASGPTPPTGGRRRQQVVC